MGPERYSAAVDFLAYALLQLARPMLRRFFLPLFLLAACSSSNTSSNATSPTSDAGTPPVVGQTPATVDPNDGGSPATGPSDAGADADAAPVVDLAPYRIIGRTDTRDPAGPKFGWAGTQVRARFHGDSITVDLGDDNADDQFDVSIDGAAPTLLKITDTRATYPLATGLPVADHELVLTKRTEASVGVAQLFALNATLIGTPLPTTNTRKIEMIGDSITNGYGVLGADQTCSFSPDTEDESMAWGALAASQLNAVHNAIAWSGIGLYRNYDQTTTGTMPDLYGLSVPTDVTSNWTASNFEPDVIVINLGTNDFAGAQSDPGPSFQSTLVTFLTTIRGLHAKAPIIMASSPMLTDDQHTPEMAYLQGAMAERKSAGDSNISVIDLPTQTGSDGYGCDWHPSAVEQQKMAAILVTQIKTLTGW